MFGAAGTRQLQLYGAVVSVHCNAPFTKNSTRVTPTLSLAFAVTAIVPLTVAPLAGDVMLTVGATVSPPWLAVVSPKNYAA